MEILVSLADVVYIQVLSLVKGLFVLVQAFYQVQNTAHETA